jgi:hypothetical protein
MRNPGTAEHHGFLWFYFVNEHFLRFLGKRYPRDYNKLPATLYWSLHLVWLFPWSLYLPAALTIAWQEWGGRRGSLGTSGRGATPKNDFAARTRLLCWILAGVVLVFFALSTNQEYYTFPAYLPLLLLLADGIVQCERTECASAKRAGWLTTSAGLLAVVGMVSSALLIAGLWHSRKLPFEPDIGGLLSKQDMSAYTLSMSHMLDLSYASFAALRLPAALAAVVLLVAPLLSFGLRVYRRHYSATWVIGAGLAVFLVAAHIALGRFGPYLSSKQLAQEIEARARPEDQVMISAAAG